MKTLALVIVLSFCIHYAFSQGGATCATAVAVGVGTHNADHSSGDQWYSYANSSSEPIKVQLSSCGLTSEDTRFTVIRNCGELLGFAGNDDGCGEQSMADFIVEASESVFIRWTDDYTSDSYNWELSTTPVMPGEICAKPRDIVEGQNVSNNSRREWYTYTNNSGAEKVVSFTGDKESYVVLYSDCNTHFASGYYLYEYLIAPGETVLVEWQNVTEWGFEIRTPEAGDKCDLSQTAVSGLNVPNHFSNTQWFTYTNNEGVEKVVETQIEDMNLIYAFDNCGSSNLLDWSTGKLSYITAPGQTLYFLTGYTQRFNLSIRDIEPGDYCSDPIVGQEGLNFNNNLGLDLWYTYTNTTDATQDIRVATNESTFIRVYTGCNTGYVQTTEYNFDHTLAPGETVYFQMEKTEAFSIDIGNALPGNNCENAITAQFGKNYPSLIQEDQWFTYTNNSASAQYIKIDYDDYLIEPIANTFAILESCSDPVPNLNRAFSGRVELPAGNSFLLHYFNVTSWTMSEFTPAPGHFCSVPKPVQPGTNTTDHSNGSQWYTYTNTTAATQSVEIKSCGLSDEDTYVYVYDGCNGNLLAENDDDCGLRSRLDFDVLAGETVYIKWGDDYTSESYDWTFVVNGINANADPNTVNAFKVLPTVSFGEYKFTGEVESVEVYTMMGAMVKSEQRVSAVNLSGYSPGMYTLKLTIGDEIRTFRVLKQ